MRKLEPSTPSDHRGKRVQTCLGSFSPGWTHIELTNRGLLFYNQATGAAGLGSLSQGIFKNIESHPAGFFAPDWTHVFDTGDFTLFYRAHTGEGAVVVLSPSPHTIKNFPVNSFARGWTHIVHSPTDASVMLFYNGATGAAAIAEKFNSSPPPGGGFPPPSNDIRTLKTFPPGSFAPDWTHIVQAPDQRILFYNRHNRSGALGTLDRNGFNTVNTFPGNSFGDFTNIVSAGDSILFYSADDGHGVIGFNPTLHIFPAGSFGTFTQLASSVDLIVG